MEQSENFDVVYGSKFVEFFKKGFIFEIFGSAILRAGSQRQFPTFSRVWSAG